MQVYARADVLHDRSAVIGIGDLECEGDGQCFGLDSCFQMGDLGLNLRAHKFACDRR